MGGCYQEPNITVSAMGQRQTTPDETASERLPEAAPTLVFRDDGEFSIAVLCGETGLEQEAFHAISPVRVRSWSP
jgi:hypothetical protein